MVDDDVVCGGGFVLVVAAVPVDEDVCGAVWVGWDGVTAGVIALELLPPELAQPASASDARTTAIPLPDIT